MIQPETDLLVAPEARPALARRRRRALKRSGIVLSLLVCVCVAMIYALARAGVPIRDGALAWLRSSRADAASTVAIQPAIERPALPATIEPTRKRVAPPAVPSRLASNAPTGGRASSSGESDEEPDVVSPPPTVDPDPEVPIANLLDSLTPDELHFVNDVVGGLEASAGGLVGDGAVGATLAGAEGLAGGVLSDAGGIAGDALSGAGGDVGGVISGAGGGVGGVISDPGGTVGGVVGGLLK